MPETADLVVVGGGPAGLAAAIAAHLGGLSAIVLDKRQGVLDKACGEGLMPSGVAALQGFGVEVAVEGWSRFTGIAYIDGDVRAEADFPSGSGMGIRRVFLHEALVQRAEALGVELRWSQKVTGLADGGVQTEAGLVRGRFVVGADGLHSAVRHWLGLGSGAAKLQRFALRRHYRVRPWSKRVEVHWADDCEAYVTPTGPERVGIAFLWSGGKSRYDKLMTRFPRLAERLEGAEVETKVRGAGPLWQKVSGVTEGRVALMGDAAGYIDAITGEGLSVAFHQARALVHAVQADDLSLYARAHKRITTQPFALIRLLLFIEARPWLRRRVLLALANNAPAFSDFLGLNDGSLRPHALRLTRHLRLAGRILVPGGPIAKAFADS